ncbi:MAG: helix-turn-helix domain-containing protein [Myxococcota bacterium]
MTSPAATQIAPSERLAFRAKEVAALLGISERKLREIQHALPRVVIGGVILFPRLELEAWLAKEAAADAEKGGAAVDTILRGLMSGHGG